MAADWWLEIDSLVLDKWTFQVSLDNPGVFTLGSLEQVSRGV
jgi:hypothetical protein